MLLGQAQAAQGRLAGPAVGHRAVPLVGETGELDGHLLEGAEPGAPGRHRPAPGPQLLHHAERALRVDVVEEVVVDRHDRAVVARRQALGVLQGDLPVRGGLVVADAQVLGEGVVDLLAAEHVAHGVGADADQVVTGRLALVHGVEGGDRADLGLVQAEHLGAELDPGRGDVPLLGLHQVQQRQQGRAGPVRRVPGDDLPCPLPGLFGESRHRSQPPITGSSEAPPAITSAIRPPSAIAGRAWRLTKLGSR
ncbi:hypothetical protein B0E53_03745 [Micromonospora sp. MH33]|nr:hypothetical protein B0E53_03745 [Micromonospora sp. MH33]